MKEITIKDKQQLGRFAIVGAINTVLDFGLLFIFKSFGIPIEIANMMSTGVAFIFSFFANKKYTFKTTDTNIVREMILFIVVTMFGLWVLQTAVIKCTFPYMINLLHDINVALLASKLLATIVSLVWNYVLYDRLVFKKH